MGLDLPGRFNGATQYPSISNRRDEDSMKLEKSCAFLLLVLLVTAVPVWAEEPEKQPGESASDTGKNEIPVCPKLVPIEVVLDPGYPQADRVEVINKYEIPKRVEYAVACEMERQKY